MNDREFVQLIWDAISDALAKEGFGLGGGLAMRAHGIVDRETQDIDAFRKDPLLSDPEAFERAEASITALLSGRGFTVEKLFHQDFGRKFEVTGTERDSEGDLLSTTIDLGRDRLPGGFAEIPGYGSVVNRDDMAGMKMRALWERQAERDYVDYDAMRRSAFWDASDLTQLLNRTGSIMPPDDGMWNPHLAEIPCAETPRSDGHGTVVGAAGVGWNVDLDEPARGGSRGSPRVRLCRANVTTVVISATAVTAVTPATPATAGITASTGITVTDATAVTGAGPGEKCAFRRFRIAPGARTGANCAARSCRAAVGPPAICEGGGALVIHYKMSEQDRPVAAQRACLHNESMKNVLIRDMPEDVHARLQARARERGQSLQQYLANELRRLAEAPTLDEVLARIETRSGGRVGFAKAVSDLEAERSADQSTKRTTG